MRLDYVVTLKKDYTREEIIALTTFFYVNGISKFKVINMDEKYLDLLPSGISDVSSMLQFLDKLSSKYGEALAEKILYNKV